MRDRSAQPPRRTRGPEFAHQARSGWEAARWKAARQGVALSRERRLLGAVYTLVDQGGNTTILYTLAEVHRHLDQPPPPGSSPAS